MPKYQKQATAFTLALLFLGLPMLCSAEFDFNPMGGCEQSGLPCGSVYDVLITILNFGLAILTILGVIGFIISGIIYITAGGAGKADLARHWLTNSIIGLIVGMSGYIVIRLIVSLLNAQVDV